jgi:hypothetical protein
MTFKINRLGASYGFGDFNYTNRLGVQMIRFRRTQDNRRATFSVLDHDMVLELGLNVPCV